MVLRKIGWKLGLTEEKRTEVSKVLYEEGGVTAKNYQLEDDWLGFALGVAMLAPVPRFNDEYNISFRGQKTSFNIDNKMLFEEFNVGDKVRIGFREKYDIISDYVPPNFKQKQQIGGGFLGVGL